MDTIHVSTLRQEIINKTSGEIRSFLEEISNGTSRYRSLHNLTEQVEHQYHGRFLIELIQNAHDALFEEGSNNMGQRIEIVLAEDEQPHGSLYIANDGLPFTQSNFKALSNLGQSDKDPEKSIGNKGIGFRSVLEISNSPEIYSRKESISVKFDGYCFRFEADVVKRFKYSIRQMLDGENDVNSPLDIAEPLVMWDESRHEYFRRLCQSLEKDWLSKELGFLSPYALPIPIDEEHATPIIEDFEKRGFSTVIRLPFLSERAKELANEKLEGMDKGTVTFLQRVNIMKLVSSNVEKCFQRKQSARQEDTEGGYEVQITSCTKDSEKNRSDICTRYWLWSKTIGGAENPKEMEDIRNAVSDLPGKWPDVKEATVSIAVQVGEVPEDGVLNIYLPTDVPSGCSAHFSAPFYGDMSRTDIDFEKPFNQLLLKTITEKIVEVILSSLAGNGEEEAAAIIDILAPMKNVEGERWWDVLRSAFAEKDSQIESAKIVLSDDGWRSLSSTSLLPTLNSEGVIDTAMLRLESTYPVFTESLLKRKDGIIRIFEAIGIGWEASSKEIAATVEAIARKLHTGPGPVDWNGFWQDVMNLFERDTAPLIGRNVLLGTDNQLHACDDTCSVFFRPRRGGTDDEVLAEDDVDDIPENLRPYIAFLHESIQIHIPRLKGGIQTTPVHAYLSSGLVETYGVERIFSNVLIKATPKLPLPITKQSSNLCRDILQWSLRLLIASTGSMDKPIRLLRRLPAPCQGGWYPFEETSFGPGWPEKIGLDLENYLQQVNTKECRAAIKRILLPPDHPLWGELGLASSDHLERAGVFNGIRLTHINSKDWESQFTIGYWNGVNLPEKHPPGYSSDVWKKYRQFIENSESPKFSGNFKYELHGLYKVPGFEMLDSFDDETSSLLMRLLLTSIPSWESKWENWASAMIRKIGGERHQYTPDSPLTFSLKETAWMQGETDEGTIQFCPYDRWYIASPAQIGGLHQFSHLKPIPTPIVSTLGRSLELLESMKKLGMPSYNPEENTTDPRLLNDLAAALEDPSTDIFNTSVFIGQVRTAWRQFYPDEGNIFPNHIIVQRGSSSLGAVAPSQNDPVYIPDARTTIHEGLKLHSKPVVVMETKDAKRLQTHFQNVYGDGIRLASKLTMRPLVDGEFWQQNGNATRLSEEIPWLIPVVLAAFAFSGGQSRGVGTNTFTKAMDALRRTRISWVDGLEAGLWYGDLSEARTSVSALWLSKYNTLLAIHDAQRDLSQLSEGLATVVDRADLDIPLKLVLGSFEGADEITEEDIHSSLNNLHISQDQYQEVQQRWLGDLAWTIRLIQPLVLILQPEADIAQLDDVSSEAELHDFLRSCDLSPLDVDGVLSIVRGASGLMSVGYSAWEILGNQLQLNQWNRVLLQISESTVINDQANEQFQVHLDSCRTLLRSIIRSIIRQHPESENFQELDESLSSISCPEEYIKNYWVVGFNDVMLKVLDLLQKWHADSHAEDAVRDAKSRNDLRVRLDVLGLEPDLDPVEIHANNNKMFLRVLGDVQKIAIAWCVRNNTGSGIWGQDTSNLIAQFVEDLTKTAFVDYWDEETCLRILKKLNRSQVHEAFWSALDVVTSVKALMSELNMSEDELSEAHGQLERRRQEQDIQKKTVNVCGTNFVNTEDNLSNLWDHIVGIIQDENISTLDLSDLEGLKDQFSSKKRQRNHKTPTNNKKKPKGRMSQSMKNLIGLAGEIHAFRALQKIYGIDAVGPTSWISENSRNKYPENTTNDGFGCDFIIHKDGKEYFVEVKATQEENETFQLGSSEVELAIDSSNRRIKEFLILHVLNALTDTPKFRLLPNPYDRKHRDKYKFEEAGLRVRYQVS